jgi:hypothetical protein
MSNLEHSLAQRSWYPSKRGFIADMRARALIGIGVILSLAWTSFLAYFVAISILSTSPLRKEPISANTVASLAPSERSPSLGQLNVSEVGR